MSNRVAAPPPAFPPGVVVAVKALAGGELPHRIGKPLSRFSVSEIHREVLSAGLVAQISGTTVWRWLSQDALHPGRHRTWIFPRAPAFAEIARATITAASQAIGRIIDMVKFPASPVHLARCASRLDCGNNAIPHLTFVSGLPLAEVE